MKPALRVSPAIDRRIDLELPQRDASYPARRYDTMFYQGREIGRSDVPICAAARWLLGEGIAGPDDVIGTYRGETLCMYGRAGELAEWTVRENRNGRPSLQLAVWGPFAAAAGGPISAKTGFHDRSNLSFELGGQNLMGVVASVLPAVAGGVKDMLTPLG
jgi:hypothetical protein